MICCKIITNYSDPNGSFKKLCELLGKKGDWMWDGSALYFSDVEGDITEKQVYGMVKKAGYTKSYIEVYSAENEPHETDEVKNWVADKLMKIYYLDYERKNQQILRETKQGLEEINQELDTLIEEALKQKLDSEKAEDN